MIPDSVADHPRPWVDHYPEGITWDVKLNLTPVHEQVLAACAKSPDAIALDFLGGRTTFGHLASAIRAFAGALQTKYGVTKGKRVALLLPNTPFYVVAYYGVLLRAARSSTAIRSILFTSLRTSPATPMPTCW